MSGSGKSTLGKRLRDSSYAVHDIENIPNMFVTTDTTTKKVLKEWDTNNLEQIRKLEFTCDKRKLAELINQEQANLTFYVGTASNIKEIVTLFDKVILLKASPAVLRDRLSTRTTHDFARVPEMQDWIIEIKNSFEQEIIKKGAAVIDADGDIEETLGKVLMEVNKGSQTGKMPLILEASTDDVQAISEVQKKTWLSTFPNEEYGITHEDILSEDFFGKNRIEKRKEIIGDSTSNTKFWVVKSEGKVVGYSCARKLADHNKIRSIYILPEFQGKGIGQKLMSAMFEWLDSTKPTKLTVAIYSPKAISFYEKLGFVRGQKLAKNPEGPFITGKEVPEMEMIKNPSK